MSWTKTRSEIALWRKNRPNEPVPVEMYQELKAGRLAEHVQKVVSSSPPMTDEQKAKIAALLGAAA